MPWLIFNPGYQQHFYCMLVLVLHEEEFQLAAPHVTKLVLMTAQLMHSIKDSESSMMLIWTINIFDTNWETAIRKFSMEWRCSILCISTGELVGFAQDENGLATHILTWMVVAVKPEHNLKFVLGYTATRRLTSYFIYPQFWRAVAQLEVVCRLKVCSKNWGLLQPHESFLSNQCFKLKTFHQSTLSSSKFEQFSKKLQI